MSPLARRPLLHSASALLGALLWGVVEMLALARSRWSARPAQRR